MNHAAIAALAEPCRQLWNGDLGLTNQIIHPDFVAHAAPITGGPAADMKGRQALNDWVRGIHALLPDLNFAFDVGPIIDRDYLVLRWKHKAPIGAGSRGRPTTPSEIARPSLALTRCASKTASSSNTGRTPTVSGSASNSA